MSDEHRPYDDPDRPGRLDINGVEWWACDPYPTWYRWDGDVLRVDPAKWHDSEEAWKAGYPGTYMGGEFYPAPLCMRCLGEITDHDGCILKYWESLTNRDPYAMLVQSGATVRA